MLKSLYAITDLLLHKKIIMEQALDQIREKQKESWNKFSPGWRKWDKMTMDFLNPQSLEMIRSLSIKPEGQILDIASGTGEPALSMAKLAIAGKVILTDLSEGMLEVAKEKAAQQNIMNIETRICDAGELPFENNLFDVVSCRLGFMFFPDMQMAAHEINRVLKQGGRFTTSVWDAPEKNFWVGVMAGTIHENMDLEKPEPGSPGIFRCADKNMMTGIFKTAGFRNITVKEVNGSLNCDTAETYWDMMIEVAAPFAAALSNADETTIRKIKLEVLEKLQQKYTDGNIKIDAASLVFYAEK
jgi:ubiquinone/menaquinone biosynthesis C-methylase UbiE